MAVSQIAIAQVARERELKTTLTDVTVFLSSAQLFESGSMTLHSGRTLLRVKGLSQFVDGKSIQVKSTGKLTVLSVNHTLNYLQAQKRFERVDSIRKKEEAIATRISQNNARLEVLKEKQAVLIENRKLSYSGLGVAQLKQAVDFYDTEFGKITDERLKLNASNTDLSEDKTLLSLQLKAVNDQKIAPTSEIEILVAAEASTPATFGVSYLVTNASWFPKYDLRAKNIKSPLELTYKAEVHQNTGLDWMNVKLKFSNGNPQQTGLVPDLLPWTISFSRYTTSSFALRGMSSLSSDGIIRGKIVGSDGSPIPGVNVVIKGSTNGTVTDANGDYNLTAANGENVVFSFIGYQTVEAAARPIMDIQMKEDVMQLSEVVVTGYGMAGYGSGIDYPSGGSYRPRAARSKIVTTTVIENQTTVEMAVDVPYTIRSGGEKQLVDLTKYDLDASYRYYTVPKLDKDAFLVAQVADWDQYNLLEGEANLYFEDTYIGRSLLDAKAMKDTLTISLGRDKNIVIGRTKTQFSRERSIGSNRVDLREFKTTIRNKKSQPIKLTVFDQIPISVIGDVVVSVEEISNGSLEEKTGKVSWEIEVDPQEQKELTLKYAVKYPKRERVILE